MNMKKVFFHMKRVLWKYWSLIIIVSIVSLALGVVLYLIMTIISLLFFDNFVDVNAILKNFTDEQLEIIFSEEMDESVCDDDYLTLLARYQSYFCPKKMDRKTVWTNSMVTSDAYIFSYELKGNDLISMEQQKERIFSQINTNGVHVKRLVSSNRKLIFRYTYRQTGKTVEIVFTPDELRENKMK